MAPDRISTIVMGDEVAGYMFWSDINSTEHDIFNIGTC